jgi:hemophore-related protein
MSSVIRDSFPAIATCGISRINVICCVDDVVRPPSKRVPMLVSGCALRSAVLGMIGGGAIAGAMLFGGASLALADPSPPNCTAGDLAVASGTVGTAMGDYLFSHPEVNDFFTSLRGQPNEEIHDRVQTYMDAHPQVQSEITGIRQPLTDLRSRCDVAALPLGS